MERPIEVPGGKQKQDITIGDSSGTLKFTVWQEEIDTMEEDVSYRISGVVVREFKGKKFLSTSKQDSFIEEIEGIGDVEEEGEDDQNENEHDYRVYNNNDAVKVCRSCIYVYVHCA